MLTQVQSLAEVPHEDGNNYQATRQRRVNVDCYLKSNASQPRWYFPDIPDLTNKLIVGIEIHVQAGDEESDEDLNDQKSPSGLNYWTGFDARLCFVNLVNTEKALICQNFPAYQFYNAKTSNATFGTKTGKIIPVFAYLLFRECFLFYPDSDLGLPKDFTATFTFFHLD